MLRWRNHSYGWFDKQDCSYSSCNLCYFKSQVVKSVELYCIHTLWKWVVKARFKTSKFFFAFCEVGRGKITRWNPCPILEQFYENLCITWTFCLKSKNDSTNWGGLFESLFKDLNTPSKFLKFSLRLSSLTDL